MEDDVSCPPDCPILNCVCGDGQCEPLCGEGPFSCQPDCLALCVCGNLFCEGFCGETPASCPFDC
jgi:hypothetical protein